jgi:outer membrane biosynthesis protein TonB
MIPSEIEVEVKVLIDEAGRVLKAEPVSQPAPVSAFLIGAARNAALLWRFEPAKRAGRPVQSEMIIKFRFHPAART